MKWKISDVISYLATAILPTFAFIITSIILRKNPTLFNGDIYVEFIFIAPLITAATAFIASIIFPICNTWFKAILVTIPTFITYLEVTIVVPIISGVVNGYEIHESEDYMVYVLLCGVVPFIGLVFWIVIAFSTWAGARIGSLIRSGKITSGFRRN
jgi:hypothetical protein